MIVRLPEEIIRLLQSFLSNDDYHYFMNTSSQYFGELKKRTIYFALNEEYSQRYIIETEFQSLLFVKVSNGWKQIGLVLGKEFEFHDTLPIHRIRFRYGCPPLQSLGHIKSIIDGSFDEQVIPSLPKVLKLIIKNGDNIENVNNLSSLYEFRIKGAKQLTEINALKNVPILSFERCGIQNISMLGNQIRLTIESCPIVDVSSLSRIRYLSLIDCYEITDVSPLFGVYSLNISFCIKVLDISSLGGHYRLIFSSFRRVKGFHCLSGVPHIELNHCHIGDSSFLRGCKSVKLFDCNDFDPMDLVNAKIVQVVCGTMMKNSVDVLKDVYDLTLGDNMNTTSIPWNNYRLNIIQNPLITDYSFIMNLQHLLIQYQENLLYLIRAGNVSYFQHLQSLTIDNNIDLEHVNGLGNIPILNIKRCYELWDLSGLGRNRSVSISFCRKIKDVSSLATVPIVTIRGCSELIDSTCLSKVERLKIIK